MTVSSHLSFRMIQHDEAPLCGALVVQSILQRRGPQAIKGCHQKIAAIWGNEIKVTAQKPQAMVFVALDDTLGKKQGVLASAPLADQPRIMEIEHFYTLKSPHAVGKNMMAHLLDNLRDVDVIKVNSARKAISFYQEQIGFKHESSHMRSILFLYRDAQGAWDVTSGFKKFMQSANRQMK